jgi:hypothetical protein
MEEHIMAFNKNELILDRVRSLTAHDLETNEILLRLTSLEDPSLNTSAEGEEVTDAIGALITTLYRAKKATFSASNSLISLDLAAAQYGSKKELAPAGGTVDYGYEVLTASDGVVKLEKLGEGKKLNVDSIKYIYTVNGKEISSSYPKYEQDLAVEDTKFTVAEDGTITLPTAVDEDGKKVFADGVKVYVEYTYSNVNAIRVVNRASEFPSAVSVVIYAYFRDVCNENTIYSGKIICPKAKLNPESVELALTSTGKHPFEFVINRDYCAEEGEDTLFEIIVSE